MGVLNIEEDAKAAFEVLERGGTCILPMDVGYAFLGGTDDSIMHICCTARERIMLVAKLSAHWIAENC